MTAPAAEAPEHDAITCPRCGLLFDLSMRKPRMVWSRRLEQYVRAYLSDAEWEAYDQRGSID